MLSCFACSKEAPGCKLVGEHRHPVAKGALPNGLHATPTRFVVACYELPAAAPWQGLHQLTSLCCSCASTTCAPERDHGSLKRAAVHRRAERGLREGAQRKQGSARATASLIYGQLGSPCCMGHPCGAPCACTQHCSDPNYGCSIAARSRAVRSGAAGTLSDPACHVAEEDALVAQEYCYLSSVHCAQVHVAFENNFWATKVCMPLPHHVWPACAHMCYSS